MSGEAKKPLTELQKMKSFTSFKVEKISETPDILSYCKEFEQRTFVVVWMHHKVIWGLWDGKQLVIPDNESIHKDCIVEFRVFNQEQEVRGYNIGSCWEVRKIVDSSRTDKGKEQEYIDSIAPFFGDISERINDTFSKCSDKGRKIHQIIPFVNQKKGRIGLATRNYLGYSDRTGQVSYTVSRYLDIISINEE